MLAYWAHDSSGNSILALCFIGASGEDSQCSERPVTATLEPLDEKDNSEVDTDPSHGCDIHKRKFTISLLFDIFCPVELYKI